MAKTIKNGAEARAAMAEGVNKLADTNILSLNFKLTIKKSSFEPTEIQFDCETGKNDSALTTKFTGKRTFSEINTAKVTKPEGIK